jgi:hypothetical protein
VQEQADKDKREKEAAAVQSAINSAIESYECYRGPNRVDLTLTESRKQKLRAYRDANKHRDQVKVLTEIRQTILNYPDPNERSR